MTKLVRWLRALFFWLLEARIFWLALLVAGGAIACVTQPCVTEATIRIVGMLLQLLGIGTVAWGIRETRSLFGRPSLVELSRQWLGRFPRLTPISFTGTSSAMLTLGGTAQGYGTASASLNATIEERVVALERNIHLLHERISGTQHLIDSGLRKQAEALKEEASKRAEDVQGVNAKLEATETGGLHISAMGALWLFVGVIMNSIPVELSEYIKRLF